MGYDMEMEEYHDDKKRLEELRPSFYDDLSKEDKEELDKLLKEITEEAVKVVEDYAKNPSDMSGSAIQIHEDSPHLKEK